MADAGGPRSTGQCPGLALADLGDTEGFEKDGEEGQLYGLQLSDGVYKRKKVVTQEGGGAQKLGELRDVDVSYASPKRLHMLAFTGSRWVAFADPVQETGWLMDVKVSAPYVVTGQQHKIRKVINAGIRLCSYVPGTKNVVVSERYTLKTFSKWFLSSLRLGSLARDCLLPRSFSSLSWEIGPTTLLMSYPGSRSSGPKRTGIKRWGPISEYRILLKCVSHLRGSGFRRTTTCWI